VWNQIGITAKAYRSLGLVPDYAEPRLRDFMEWTAGARAVSFNRLPGAMCQRHGSALAGSTYACDAASVYVIPSKGDRLPQPCTCIDKEDREIGIETRPMPDGGKQSILFIAIEKPKPSCSFLQPAEFWKAMNLAHLERLL
jgi:hypothetical protein